MRRWLAAFATAVPLVHGAAAAQSPCILFDPTYGVSSPFWNYQSLVVGDLDGQNGPDVCILAPGRVGVFLNRGNGTFDVRSEFVWWFNSYETCAVLIDIERDGDLDLVVGKGFGNPLVLLNDGRGRMVVQGKGVYFADEVGIGAFAAGDVDGDGFDDLVGGGGRGAPARLFLNTGAGRFVDVTATHMPVLTTGVGELAAVDLDADGDLDFPFAGGASGPTPEYNGILWNDVAGRMRLQTLQGTRRRHTTVSVGDIDGDGRPDLFFGSSEGAELWLNLGGGAFFDGSQLLGNATSAICSAFGDVDGDGMPDLVVCSFIGEAHVELHRNLGLQQGFVRDTLGVSQPHSRFTVLRMFLRDMDRDGDLDLVSQGGPPIPYVLGLWIGVNTARHVLPRANPSIGAPWAVALWAQPGQFMLPLFGTARADLDLTPIGRLGLDPASLVVLPPISIRAQPQYLTLTVPSNPRLVGQTFYWQGLVVDPAQPNLPRLTNWMGGLMR